MRVAFVGNRQAAALAELFTEFVQAFTGDEWRFIAVSGIHADAELAFIREADVVIDQVFEFDQEFDAAAANPRGRIVRFPHVAAPFLYPYGLAAHPRNAPHPALPDGPYPEGCRYLRELLEAGSDAQQDPDRIVADWLAADLGELVPLDRIYEHAMAAQRRRDFRTGFRCSEIIAARLREQPCFHSIDHPTGPVLLHLAEETFRRMEVDARLIARLSRLVGRAPVSVFEQPVHPSVARRFGLSYATPETRYAWAGEGRFTIAEWARRYVAYEWNPELHEGSQLLRTGRPAEAVAILRTAAAQPASRAAALALMGEALRDSGALDEAIATLRDAVRMAPVDPEPRVSLARALDRAGRLEDAATAWADAAALDPRLVAAQVGHAEVLRRLGRLGAAALAARAASQQDPDAPILQARMSVVLREAGEAAAADALLAQAEAADWPGLDAQLSFALGDAGRPASAVDRARRALQRSEDPELHAHLGNLLRGVGEHVAAVEAYRRAGELHVKSGALVAAEAILHTALESAPTAATLHAALGEVLLAQGRGEAAVAAAQAAADHDPILERLMYVGHLASKFGRHRQSALAFCRAAALAPQRADVLTCLSHALTSCGHNAEAVAVARQATRLQPDDANPLCHLGNLLLLSGDPVGAEEAYRAAVAAAPDERRALEGLAEALARQGRLPAAASAPHESVATLPDPGSRERLAKFELRADAVTELNPDALVRDTASPGPVARHSAAAT